MREQTEAMKKFLIIRRDIFKMEDQETVKMMENSLEPLFCLDIDSKTKHNISQWIRSPKFGKIQSPTGIISSIFTKCTSYILTFEYRLFPETGPIEHTLVTCVLKDDTKWNDCLLKMKVVCLSKRLAREIFSWHLLETCYSQFLNAILENCGKGILGRYTKQLEKLRREEEKKERKSKKSSRSKSKKKKVKLRESIRSGKSKHVRGKGRVLREEGQVFRNEQKTNQGTLGNEGGNWFTDESHRTTRERQNLGEVLNPFDDFEEDEQTKGGNMRIGSGQNWKSQMRATGGERIVCGLTSQKIGIQIGNIQSESVSNQNAIPISLEKQDYPQSQRMFFI